MSASAPAAISDEKIDAKAAKSAFTRIQANGKAPVAVGKKPPSKAPPAKKSKKVESSEDEEEEDKESDFAESSESSAEIEVKKAVKKKVAKGGAAPEPKTKAIAKSPSKK